MKKLISILLLLLLVVSGCEQETKPSIGPKEGIIEGQQSELIDSHGDSEKQSDDGVNQTEEIKNGCYDLSDKSPDGVAAEVLTLLTPDKEINRPDEDSVRNSFAINPKEVSFIGEASVIAYFEIGLQYDGKDRIATVEYRYVQNTESGKYRLTYASVYFHICDESKATSVFYLLTDMFFNNETVKKLIKDSWEVRRDRSSMQMNKSIEKNHYDITLIYEFFSPPFIPSLHSFSPYCTILFSNRVCPSSKTQMKRGELYGRAE